MSKIILAFKLMLRKDGRVILVEKIKNLIYYFNVWIKSFIYNNYSELEKSSRRYEQQINRLNREINLVAPAPLITRYTRKAIGEIKYAPEITIAHGIQALPAAAEVAKSSNGRVFCDCIEIPSFFDRILPSRWDEVSTRFADYALEGYLRRCDGILTVGWTLGDHLAKYGPPVTVIPNYRYAEALSGTVKLRQQCKIDNDSIILLSLGTVTTQLEAVIKAVSLLPKNIHFVSLGSIVPSDYEEKCRNLVAKLGISSRVHFLDMVPYKKLTATAAGADIGLMIRDPVIVNNFVSLPNRIFDFMFSGLPVVSPMIPDIAKIISDQDMGVVLQDYSPDSWADGINDAIKDCKRSRNNAIAASRKYTWETIEQTLFEALGQPESVTFMGFADLKKNNRTMRMVKSLRQFGTKVNMHSNVRI